MIRYLLQRLFQRPTGSSGGWRSVRKLLLLFRKEMIRVQTKICEWILRNEKKTNS